MLKATVATRGLNYCNYNMAKTAKDGNVTPHAIVIGINNISLEFSSQNVSVKRTVEAEIIRE